MPLEVIVVGAGIAGLSAAIALRQAGHLVKIFEKSQFLSEAGAALLLTPNGVRVLSHLDFSFSNARADEMTRWEVLDGIKFRVIEQTSLHDSEDRYGAKIYTVHRSDLHNELIRLVLAKIEGQPDVKLYLGSAVRHADAEEGFIELENGTQYRGDLIVGADGVHSVLKNLNFEGHKAAGPVFSGMNAFRFQIPTVLLEKDERFLEMVKLKGKGSTVLVDTKELKAERHLVWYDCQGGSVQNFVGIHQINSEVSTDLKTSMLAEFGHFYPSIVHIISMAPEVTDWPLYIHDPLPSWVHGKLVLIGDAAHPMLPFGGQGANQGIEDAGALGFLLEGLTAAEDLPCRLALFEKVRRLRASRIQLLSTVRLGKEKSVEQELKNYTDFPGQPVPTSFPERYDHDFGFNVYEKCREVLQGQK